MGTMFMEPSTRTRWSFEAGFLRLKGRVVSAHSENSSAQFKGESFEDTLNTCALYVDTLVVRTSFPLTKPSGEYNFCINSENIINAGDGKHEHPTQAILDAYTMWKKFGKLENLHIGIVGDLPHSRTIHSLLGLLGRNASNSFTLYNPTGQELQREYEPLAPIFHCETEDQFINQVPKMNVVYLNRMQKERWGVEMDSGLQVKAEEARFSFNREYLDILPREAIVMNPGPRLDEMPVLDDDRILYYEQAQGMEKHLTKWIMPIVASILLLGYWYTNSGQYTHPESHQIEFKTLLEQPDGITCGPTSATMVLKRYGKDVKLSDVKSKTKTEWFKYGRQPIGMTSPDMIPVAMKNLGVPAKMRRGTIKELKYFVSTNRPVIVLVRSGKTTWHYIVVVGYTKKDFTVADPGDGKISKMKLEHLKGSWEFTTDMSGNSTIPRCGFCKGSGEVADMNAGPLTKCPMCEGKGVSPDIMSSLLKVAEVHPKTMIALGIDGLNDTDALSTSLNDIEYNKRSRQPPIKGGTATIKLLHNANIFQKLGAVSPDMKGNAQQAEDWLNKLSNDGKAGGATVGDFMQKLFGERFNDLSGDDTPDLGDDAKAETPAQPPKPESGVDGGMQQDPASMDATGPEMPPPDPNMTILMGKFQIFMESDEQIRQMEDILTKLYYKAGLAPEQVAAMEPFDLMEKNSTFKNSLRKKVFYNEFADKLGKVVRAKLVDPYFYHLDTCFCPLNDEGDYLIYPPAFDAESLKAIREIGNIEVQVPEDEAKQFACNAVVIDNNVILPWGCEETEAQLQGLGYETHGLMMMPVDKQELVDLVKEFALEFAPEGEFFTLKSGAKSKFYLDCRKLTLSARGAHCIATHLYNHLARDRFHAVGGPCVGADPIVGAFLFYAVMGLRPQTRGFLVRKESKEHGKSGRIIGSVRPGDEVVMFEDVTTSGGSSLDAIEAIEDFGAKVVQVVSVVDRQAGATELFAEKGIPFHSLLNLDDLGVNPKQECAQTGADIAGLEVAQKFGLETGGTMPFGFKALDGCHPEYKEMYGIEFHSSSSYVPRTRKNVRDADGTIRLAFDFTSKGEKCTLKAIEDYEKPHIDVDLSDPIPVMDVITWIRDNNIETLNVAGNSEQTVNGTHAAATDFLTELLNRRFAMSDEKTLIVMRGLPWTGKSTRAKELAGDSGLIYSTDDYWYEVNKPDKPDEYSFNPRMLHHAHKWNQLRAQRSIDMGEPLIIIDNTNTTPSEPKEYVQYASWQDYNICIEEPTSPQWGEIAPLLLDKRGNKKALKEWAAKLEEGSKENHNVPAFAIEKMMWRWHNNLTVEEILGEKEVMKKLFLSVLSLMLLGATAQAQTSFESLVGKTEVGDVSTTGPTQVPYITWGGDVATFHANGGGLTTKADSIFGKAGLNLKLTPGDDFVSQVRDYMSGKTPYLRGTFRMVSMASELLNSDPRTKPVMIYQLTWSAGDHIVGTAEIKTLNDLKGKKVALQQGGPHLGLLADSLEAAGLSFKDITPVWCKDLTASDDSPAEKLRKGLADAACVITPDMIGLCSGLESTGSGAEGTVKGSHVVNSTASMSRSIADVYVVRSDYFTKEKGKVESFVVGLMKGTEELVAARKKYNDGKGKAPEYITMLKNAQTIFTAEVLPTIEEDAHGLVLDANFVRIPGNEIFFNDSNNLVGFDSKQKSGLELAVALGYSKQKLGFVKGGWDYSDLSKKAGVTYVKPTYATGRVKAEVTDFAADLDTNTILSFEIKFEPEQSTFSIESYASDFQRVAQTASTFGNAVIVIEGHSDPTLSLMHFFWAAKAKGLLTGSTGNYKFNGKPLALTDTDAIIAAVNSNNLSGQQRVNKAGKTVDIPNPRDTVAAALSLSQTRAGAVKKSIEEYVKQKGLTLDLSQVQPYGVGIAGPVNPRPRNMGQAKENMRVVFRVVRIRAESLSEDDFNFEN
ncbi:PYRB [Symbiodinium microadriaticum]|nr:PYRB [Symbiodinium microadriaticum]